MPRPSGQETQRRPNGVGYPEPDGENLRPPDLSVRARLKSLPQIQRTFRPPEMETQVEQEGRKVERPRRPESSRDGRCADSSTSPQPHRSSPPIRPRVWYCTPPASQPHLSRTQGRPAAQEVEEAGRLWLSLQIHSDQQASARRVVAFTYECKHVPLPLKP